MENKTKNSATKNNSAAFKRFQTLDLTYIALSASLIVICSWISIPTTVPFTLQTFAVCLISGIFGTKRATLAVIIYILLGAIGIPVFSDFKGGIGSLFGVTGGYIIGFIFSAAIIGFLNRKKQTSLLMLLFSMLLGTIVCYAFGTMWFICVYTANTGSIGVLGVLSLCVFPFIFPDIIKITAASILAQRLRKFVK